MNNEVLMFIRNYVSEDFYDIDMFCHDVKESKISFETFRKLCSVLNMPFLMCLAELADMYKNEGQERVLNYLKDVADEVASRTGTVIVPLFREQLQSTSGDDGLIVNVTMGLSFQSHDSKNVNDVKLVLTDVGIGDKTIHKYNYDGKWEDWK